MYRSRLASMWRPGAPHGNWRVLVFVVVLTGILACSSCREIGQPALSQLSSTSFTLEDQRIKYYYISGAMTTGPVSKQVDCHVFLTLYVEHGYVTLIGILMPNENRSQGGYHNWYLEMPPEVVSTSWDPQLRVTLLDGSMLNVETRKWHAWAGDPGVNGLRCVPLTFELRVSVDQVSQMTFLQVADWEPMQLPHQVDEPLDTEFQTVIVYAHLRGEVTVDKAILLHTHLMYHHRLGIQEFWLYASYQQIVNLHAFQELKDVIESGTLRLINWPDMFCEEHSDCIESDGHHLKHQILVYNVARLAGIQPRKGLLILDTDEYLVTNAAVISNISCFAQDVLQSYAQVVLPRYDSFTCRNGERDNAVPDINLLRQDSVSFLDHFRTRSQTPYILTKGKSLINAKEMTVYEIHLGREADTHITLWQSESTAYILHLVNLWVIRECEEDIPVEDIPAWNRATSSTQAASCITAYSTKSTDMLSGDGKVGSTSAVALQQSLLKR